MSVAADPARFEILDCLSPLELARINPVAATRFDGPLASGCCPLGQAGLVRATRRGTVHTTLFPSAIQIALAIYGTVDAKNATYLATEDKAQRFLDLWDRGEITPLSLTRAIAAAIRKAKAST